MWRCRNSFGCLPFSIFYKNYPANATGARPCKYSRPANRPPFIRTRLILWSVLIFSCTFCMVRKISLDPLLPSDLINHYISKPLLDNLLYAKCKIYHYEVGTGSHKMKKKTLQNTGHPQHFILFHIAVLINSVI